MGCYCPDTGTIVLRIDRIKEESEAFADSYGNAPMEILMQKVLLHEFIHAALDLNPRNAEGKILANEEKWKNVVYTDALGSVIEFNEETIDNALVLRIYEKADKEVYDYIYHVVSNQPYHYRNAIVMKEAKESNKNLEYNLASLIQYKIYGKPSLRIPTERKGKVQLSPDFVNVSPKNHRQIGWRFSDVFS